MEILQFPEKHKKVRKCFVCEKPFQWSDDSWWYGSEYDVEEHPERLKFYCTTKCKNSAPPEKED